MHKKSSKSLLEKTTECVVTIDWMPEKLQYPNPRRNYVYVTGT